MSMKCAKCGKPCNDARSKPAVCFECATNRVKTSALAKVAKAPSFGELASVLGGAAGGYTMGHGVQGVVAAQLNNASKKAFKAGNDDLWWALKKKSKAVSKSGVGGLLGAASGGGVAAYRVAQARKQARSDSARRALMAALGIGGVGAAAANVALTQDMRKHVKRKQAALSSGAARATASGAGGGAIGGAVGALLSGAKGPAEVARAAALTGAASGTSALAGNTIHNAVQRAKHRRFLKRVGLGAGVATAAGLGGLYYYKRNQGLLEKRAFPNPFNIWRGVARTGAAAGIGGFLAGAARSTARVVRASSPAFKAESELAFKRGVAQAKPITRAARGEVAAALARPEQRLGRAAALEARAKASKKAAEDLAAGLKPDRIEAVRAQAAADHAASRGRAAAERAARAANGGALSPAAAAAAQAEQAEIKAGTRVAPAPKFADASEQKLYDLHRRQLGAAGRADRLRENTGGVVDTLKQMNTKYNPLAATPPPVTQNTRNVIEAQRAKTRAALSPVTAARADMRTAKEMENLAAQQPSGKLPTLRDNPVEFAKLHGGRILEDGLKVGIPAAAGAAALHTGANAWGKHQMINTAKKWALPVGAGVGAYALLKD